MIIFANNDLVPQVQSTLMLQLRIDEAINLIEFQARLSGTPDYPTIIQQNGIRLLVVDSYYNLTISRDIFTFCLFLKDGECSVLQCRGYGHPGITFPIARLSLAQLQSSFPKCFFDGYSDGYCWPVSCCNPIYQNNILYPLTCKTCGHIAFPFGEECYAEFQRQPNPFDLPIYCRCKG